MTELLIRLFVRGDDVKNKDVRKRYGTLGGVVGICCNILLCILKISIGIITASMSVVADGLNNLSDMGSSVMALIGFKLASKPADSDHPFGHGRFEYLSALVVSAMILLVGGELFISSIKTLISGDAAPKHSIWSVLILLFSVFLKMWLYLFNRKLGKKIDSEVLLATAKDSINDSISTAAILVSVAVTYFVNVSFNLDAVMALAVSLFIIHSGLTTAKETVDSLLGSAPDKELISQIENIILSFKEFVGIHDLIIHNYGPGRQFASVHVEVPQDIDIVSCHEQIDLCEKLLQERTDVCVVIHMDPIDVNNESINEAKKQMAEALKEIDERLTLHDFRMTPAGKTRTNLIFDVVVPSDISFKDDELKRIISQKAERIDQTYCCVITVDNDFTGK